MAIFYHTTSIIGRSSGRSAVGASAYRSGEKLHSVAHASYQSGEKLQSKNSKITHDYRKKKGVIHSEIILPDNAPSEYADRETLWNAVEVSEKRKDAQLSREIIAALPREFDLEEQIKVMQDYIKENYVNKGMIADFAIHDTKNGNPHAHIMLTTRNVSRDGFGLKNTDWNKKEKLLEYRKAWSHIINNTLERKGLDERIDHRSYVEQGLDREPMIHLGHKAAALERQGIATLRGDYNREITRRNTERAALLKEAVNMELQKLEELTQKLELIIETAEVGTETMPNELITKLKTAKRINEAQEKPNTPDKTPHILNIETPNIVREAKHRKKLRNNYNTHELDLRALKAKYNVYDVENSQLYAHAEEIDEHTKNIQTLHNRTTQLETERQTFWGKLRRKKLERKINLLEADERIAQHNLWKKYRIYSDQSPERIEQISKQIQANKTKMETLNVDITKISKAQQAILQEYREHRFMFKRQSRQREPEMPEIDPKTGRQKTMELLSYLRQKDEIEKIRRKEWEKFRRIKPQKVLMIASSEQEKRKLVDVLGKKAYSIGNPTRLSVPPRKKKIPTVG